MISRLIFTLPAAALGVALFASPAPAQVLGMRAAAAAPRARSSFRLGAGAGIAHAGHRPYVTGAMFLPSLYYDPGYDYDDKSVAPGLAPVQVVIAPPAQPPVPVAAPVESLMLEYHNGQWVRVPTGGESAKYPQAMQPDSAQEPAPPLGMSNRKETSQPLPALPRVVLVFRDGHQEEIGKYIIQGNVIYVDSDYWSTGSWTRKIPIAQIDVQATLRRNAESGGKFNLPSGPNEIMVRF
jgi:hypothetical protein